MSVIYVYFLLFTTYSHTLSHTHTHCLPSYFLWIEFEQQNESSWRKRWKNNNQTINNKTSINSVLVTKLYKWIGLFALLEKVSRKLCPFEVRYKNFVLIKCVLENSYIFLNLLIYCVRVYVLSSCINCYRIYDFFVINWLGSHFVDTIR